MKRHPGNRHIIVRGNPELHAKIGRIVAATGTDKSLVVRTALEFMSEEQIRQLIIVAARQDQPSVECA